MIISRAASHTRVAAALRDFGWPKAVMPLEIASTPVRAVVPELNARSSRKVKARPVTAKVGWSEPGTFWTVPSVPLKACHMPTPIMTSIMPQTNRWGRRRRARTP